MSSTITALTSGGGLAMAGDTSGQLQLLTNNGTAAVTIDTSQNVGIGTASPAAKLNVTGHSSNIGATFDKGATTQYGINYKNSAQTYTQYVDINNNGTNYWTLYDTTNAQIVTQYVPGASGSNAFYTAGTERMRINSNGEIAVGSAGTSGVGKFQTFQSTTGNNVTYFAHTNASGPYGIECDFTAATPNNTSNYFWYSADSTNLKAVLYSNGSWQVRANSYGGISDIKLKQDIVDASSQWNDIKNVRVRKFRFKDEPDSPLQIGVVAQELEQTSAGLVYEATDFGKDEDGNRIELGTVTKSVKYSILYMKAIKALQEAMERIEIIEAKVDAQSAEIKALKGVA